VNLTRRTFEEGSRVEVAFYTAELRLDPPRNVLVITFKSEENVKYKDLVFMNAMKLAGAEIWHSAGIILDLRELRYLYGDWMDCLFRSPFPEVSITLRKIFGEEPEGGFPIVAVVSELNSAGLISLVEKEMFKEPAKFLFNSVEEAAAAVESQWKQGRRAP